MYLHQDAEGVQQILVSAYLSGKRTEVEHMSPEG